MIIYVWSTIIAYVLMRFLVVFTNLSSTSLSTMFIFAHMVYENPAQKTGATKWSRFMAPVSGAYVVTGQEVCSLCHSGVNIRDLIRCHISIRLSSSYSVQLSILADTIRNVAPSIAVCIVIRSCGASNTSFITWIQIVCGCWNTRMEQFTSVCHRLLVTSHLQEMYQNFFIPLIFLEQESDYWLCKAPAACSSLGRLPRYNFVTWHYIAPYQLSWIQ